MQVLHKIANVALRIFIGIYDFFHGAFRRFIVFFILLNLYLLQTFVVVKLIKIPFIPKILVSRIIGGYSGFYFRMLERFDARDAGHVTNTDLIELSIKNMFAKKVRTAITIGGVSIGFGAIVFLVSIGYGLQELVINRVARLDELKQADVTTQVGSKVKINDKTISDVKELSDVREVYPLIAVVGRVNYQNSVSDMAVYGVTTEYLKSSDIRPTEGNFFESNNLVTEVIQPQGQVAGAKSVRSKTYEYGATIGKVEYEVQPGEWVRVRAGPSTGDKILGYTKRIEGTQQGEEFAGDKYVADNSPDTYLVQNSQGRDLGKWVKAKVPLWEQKSCDKKTLGCEDGKYMPIEDDSSSQLQSVGYFAEVSLNITQASYLSDESKPEVLGESTISIDSQLAAATTESTSSADTLNITGEGDNWVEIPTETGAVKAPDKKVVTISTGALKQAVVNRAMLRVLGIDENNAIGKKFKTTFVIPKGLVPDEQDKVESTEEEYQIIAVVPTEDSPYFYVPFIDLRSLGISNYTQLKLVAQNKDVLKKVRTQIEAMGYNTQSVADTVTQITSLFSSLRVVLGIMGMIALAVAALGMFNTFTVSLLERTREVGLMKAMGMRSDEVQELFLTESMIMGFWGGILGLLVGFLGGKLLGLLLSLFAIFKGVGYVDISYIPLQFVLLIIFLSLVVGVGTGVYPAMRARKISALNALRYE